MLGMSARRFYAANIVSALAWAPSNVLPGVIVGESLDLLGAAAKPLGILLVLLIILTWIILHAVRFTLRRGAPWLLALMERLRSWASGRDSRLRRAVFNLLDPSRPDAGGLALLALMLVGAAWLFLGVLENVAGGDPLVSLDDSIYHALQNLRTPPADAAMIVFTELGDFAVVIVVTGMVFLWLAGKRAWRTALYWLAAIAGASALNTAIKVALHRPLLASNSMMVGARFPSPVVTARSTSFSTASLPSSLAVSSVRYGASRLPWALLSLCF